MRRKAILLTIRPDNEEMEELIFAQGSQLVATLRQRRAQPDPQFHLGTGKLDEARDLLSESGATLVVINAALKPNQMFNIQQHLTGHTADVVSARKSDGGAQTAPSAQDPSRARGARAPLDEVEVWDRTRLILEIFRERARSPEARLQVELAQLTYDMPLVKETIHLARKGEHPGFLGGGEYEVNQYYDMMKKRMTRIKRDLEKMRMERGLRRKHRRRGGYHLVSLAGYTNAGKSSLLKALAPAPTLIENRYFSTLSTKTRRAASDKREILVTDTVGFISDLPPWLVDAFHSTLEEIAFADVTLLVLDASDEVDEMVRRLRSSLRILSQSGTQSNTDAARRFPPEEQALAPILIVLNKVDRLAPGELVLKANHLVEQGLVAPGGYVAVSAATGEGLQDLFDRIYTLLPDYDTHEWALPQTPQTEVFVAWLHDETDVLGMTRGNEVHVRFEAKTSLRPAIARQLAELGATRLQPTEELLREKELPAARTHASAPATESKGSQEGRTELQKF